MTKAAKARNGEETSGVARARLDKWLWSARFFKTRSQATTAVNGGKVHVNGNRAKAGHGIKVGDQLSISKRELQFEVDVLALAERRGSATVAQTLYAETAQSVQAREQAAMRRRQAHNSMPQPEHKPDKRERRQLRRFKTGD